MFRGTGVHVFMCSGASWVGSGLGLAARLGVGVGVGVGVQGTGCGGRGRIRGRVKLGFRAGVRGKGIVG